MSQVLSSGQSLEPPSRYTLFERDVIGASSPQSEKRPRTQSKKVGKVKKLKRFSEVAYAGESPNLEDVSSGILSKSRKSVLIVSPEEKSCRPSTSRHISPVLFESQSGSSTPSLQFGSGNVPEVQEGNSRARSAKSPPPKATSDQTVDLLTESFIESSAVINGQPNVLRIESSPDAALPTALGRLSRSQQIELSVRKTREWLNSIPDNGDAVEPPETHENSLVSSMSRRSDRPADLPQDSVLIVAPEPHIREIRIVLQRLDPQVLLRVPIRDIQNLVKTPSNLTLTQVQKTMNNLLTSNKIGLTRVDRSLMKSIQCNTVSKQTESGTASRRSLPMKKNSKIKKRKLYAGLTQPSNIPLDLDLSSGNISVQCPYTPPTVKKGRRTKKLGLPVQKGLQLKPPCTKIQSKSPCLPKQKKPLKTKSPTVNQLTVVTRTRSSDMLKAQTTPKSIQSKPSPERNNENIPATSNVNKKNHEMTLRKKSNPRRTSLFFQPKSQVSKPKKKEKGNSIKRNSVSLKNGPKVVCTFLHRGEVDTVAAVIKRLGGMIESKVSAITTHVICGGPKRTINLLRGIARGCWLVTLDWVLQSLEKRKWVDEEPYELTSFSSAVQKCRIARETLGLFPTIFEKIGTVYVAPRTAPPKSELCELLKLCGAKIVTTTRRATVAIGVTVPGVTSVSEVWVLDSIQENLLLPLQRYLLTNDQNK